ncbi:receptor-like protein kinase HSL1 [Tripterygium wilfordii]|uniref:Receptor-like protein kinase HSL1 n=1 Tax=Tripterygium wilfordii TaxID=458696 RepID=A0A7J7D9G2_TRIWF|nr:receptor-like protein kinase HSL1 [Tripterygium wilfordii]
MFDCNFYLVWLHSILRLKSRCPIFAGLRIVLTKQIMDYGGEENSFFAVWVWHHVQEGKPIVNAPDEEIKEASKVDEISTVFRTGNDVHTLSVFCRMKSWISSSNAVEGLSLEIGLGMIKVNPTLLLS